jgi:hypothetical protein
MHHVIGEPENFPRGVFIEERPHCLELVPGAILLNRPSFWIFEGPKHIVDMDYNARLEPWNYIEQLYTYIASRFQHVGTVNEKNVVDVERIKY